MPNLAQYIDFSISADSATGTVLTVSKSGSDTVSQYGIVTIRATLSQDTLPGNCVVIMRLDPPSATAPTSLSDYSVLMHMVPDPTAAGRYYLYLNEAIGKRMTIGSLNSVYYNFQVYRGETLCSQAISQSDVIQLYRTNINTAWAPDDLGNAFAAIGRLGQMDHPILQSKSASASTLSQTIEPDSGYAGLSKVTIAPVTATIDPNIQPGNIRKGITILGVTGTYEA